MRCLHRSFLVHKIFSRALAIPMFIVGMLSGCINTKDVDYPVVWPPRIPGSADQCPAMAGIYLNQGERVPKEGAGCFTACGGLIDELSNGNMFRPFTPLPDARAKERIVEILQPENTILDVVAWKNVDGEFKEISRLHLSANDDDFNCENGVLLLSARLHAATGIIINYVAPETRVFCKALDGTLVMKRTTNFMGHALVFPIVNSSSEWVRWPVANFSVVPNSQ